ncbi:MAG: SDR family oxidoreductase [Firmicutes bacterium]|nr:SDR family oxidoreductase [Bacillota bacterium]
MEQIFASDTAIVTGGTRGIGWAVANQLVDRGARVLLVGRNPHQLEQRVQELNQKVPEHAFGFACDMAEQPDSSKQITEYALKMIGRPTLLLNGAGGASVTHALDAPWTLWVDDFEVKFFGYLAMTRAILPIMMEQRRGVIVNLVGIAGKDPNPALAIASAVNGALNGVMKVLADDASAYDVRIVNVNPGATQTDLLTAMAKAHATESKKNIGEVLDEMRAKSPLKRLPGPMDIARIVIFLMSSDSQFVTGTSIDVDGGIHRGV